MIKNIHRLKEFENNILLQKEEISFEKKYKFLKGCGMKVSAWMDPIT